MKKNIKIIGIVLILIVLIVGAYAGYHLLKQYYKPQNGLLGETDPTTEQQDASKAAEDETSSEEESKKPTPAEDFTMYDADGKEVALSSFQGKVTVVNFWATWCGYCKQEMPDFQKAYEKYGDKVNFIMLNATGGKETKEKAAKYVKDEKFTFPVYYDEDQSGQTTYGIYSFPTTFIVDSQGNIAGYAEGMIDGESLENAIDGLLNQDK